MKTAYTEFKKIKEKKKFDVLSTDTDIINKKQKYVLISFIEPFKEVNKLYYSYAFKLFIENCGLIMRKIIYKYDIIYDIDICETIYNKTKHFYDNDIKEFNKNEDIIENEIIKNNQEIIKIYKELEKHLSK